MSALARANGWRGFDGIGERVDKGEFGHGPTRGGWRYCCDGMPTMRGCGQEVTVSRRFSRVGKKSTGWLVCYGQDFDGTLDTDVVLTFCPSCAATLSGGVPEDEPATED